MVIIPTALPLCVPAALQVRAASTVRTLLALQTANGVITAAWASLRANRVKLVSCYIDVQEPDVAITCI
jgi:hypothetical protein